MHCEIWNYKKIALLTQLHLKYLFGPFSLYFDLVKDVITETLTEIYSVWWKRRFEGLCCPTWSDSFLALCVDVGAEFLSVLKRVYSFRL